MNFLALFAQSPVVALAFLLSVVSAVTVHEAAHAWTAYRLGDDTPFLQGRVTLNPLAHLDPLGSLFFLIMGFGWGKPVLYNPMRLSRHVDELLIALAGPISNLLFAIFINIILHFTGSYEGLSQLLGLASYVNVILASFNLLPIPPLDGSSIIAYFWPPYRSFISSRIGLGLLLVLILLSFSGMNLLSAVISPVQSVFTQVTHLFGLL